MVAKQNYRNQHAVTVSNKKLDYLFRRKSSKNIVGKKIACLATYLVAQRRGTRENGLLQEPVFDEAHDGGQEDYVVRFLEYAQARCREGLEELLTVRDLATGGDGPQ